MTGYRDLRPARWARTVARLRRNVEELRQYGWPVPPEPDGFADKPRQRIADVSTDM